MFSAHLGGNGGDVPEESINRLELYDTLSMKIRFYYPPYGDPHPPEKLPGQRTRDQGPPPPGTLSTRETSPPEKSGTRDPFHQRNYLGREPGTPTTREPTGRKLGTKEYCYLTTVI